MIGATNLKFKVQVNDVCRTLDTLAEADQWIELCRDVQNPNEIFGDTGSNIIYDNITPIINGILRGESTTQILRGKYISIFIDKHSVNGILLIVPTKEYGEWQDIFLATDSGKPDFVAMEENFNDALEDVWTNSQLKYQYGYEWSPTFEYEPNESTWYYNDYCLESFTEAIYTDGFALFTKYQEQTI